MDGVSWSTTRSQESFSRSTTAANTLSRLASFIARAETKPQAQNQRQQPSQPSTYVCQECGKSFPYAEDLLQHQELKHTLPKPHRCPSCGQEFSLRSSLQLHKCDHDAIRCECCHGSRLGSPCPACTTRTSTPGRLQDKSLHRQPHLLDSNPYACAPCGRGFSQKQALLQHQQAGCSEPPSPSIIVNASNLPDDSPPISEGDSTRSDYSDTPGPSCRAFDVCRFCSRNFRTEAALHRHIQNNHAEEEENTKGDSADEKARSAKVNGKPKEPKSKNKLLECRSCDMVFRSTSKLYVHRKDKHSRQKTIRREPRPSIKKRRKGDAYPCVVCGKVFFHHLSLRAHYRRHTVSSLPDLENSSPSVECATKDPNSSENKPNNVKTKLEDHKTVKPAPGKPKKVSKVLTNFDDVGTCRKVPELEDELEVEGEFPCPSCAEVFSLQWQLKEHVELHQSSVRRRQCSVCADEMDNCKWPGSKRQRLYHCVPCQQGFSALDSFLEHCQEHLRARVEEDRISEGYNTHQVSKA
ncbi:zinc finger protein 835 [Cololabis saira]|uniref:zinc finger protein 835 n=1 Tax=Cololabis saira TaxID=129043 RepID=UPI002AD2A65B|nr:zinc finger protein 835 [Cololabis saira]XP_061591534.1 zinc finger protein 835 [Cololabis saira]